jgi:hypothetical protein
MSGPLASGSADLEAARLVLARMGLSAADLLAVPQDLARVPTFAEYIPVVAAAVTEGTRRVYGSYWDRVVAQWGSRRLDEPTASQVKHLAEQVKTQVVARRNARGGRGAAEHLIAALRCVYRHAEHDGLITPTANPARAVAKPRRLPSTRRAIRMPGWPRSTTSPRPPATTRPWTRSCCGCTPKPPAAAAARWRCARAISTRTSV